MKREHKIMMNKKSKGVTSNISKTMLVLFFILLGFNSIKAQLQSIEPYFGYTKTMNTRFDISDADAVGGGVKIQFKLYKEFSIRLNTGYKLYSIHQDDAITQWEWFFWDARYENTIESNLNAFKELSVDIGSIQKMDLIPVKLDFVYSFKVGEKFTVIPSVGGGVYFYTRRLYITESWTKRFEEIGYDFSYSYRNFTPDKTGNPIVAFGGLQLNYEILENFHLRSELLYTNIFSTEDEFGFNDFPFNNEITFNIGINILY